MLLLGICIGVAIYVLWFFKDCFYRVEEGQQALVIRFGGALRDAKGHLLTYGPGLHGKWPFDKIRLVSMREQLVTLSGETGMEPMMLNDGNVIRLDAMLRYCVENDNIENFAFSMHHPKEHLTGLFTCLMRNEVANVKEASPHTVNLTAVDDAEGSYALVRRERRLLNQRIAEFAGQALGNQYGVRFNAIDVTDLHPPDELAAALNAVMSARASADEARFHAQSGCAQQLLEAERSVPIARLRAEAVENEIKIFGRHLAALHEQGVLAEYVARRKAEVLAEARTIYLHDSNEVRQ